MSPKREQYQSRDANPEVVRTFSNVIPRRRRDNAEPIPRRFVATRPLVTLDAEALETVAEAFAKDPKEAQAQTPWLKARNAIEAAENTIRLRDDLEDRMEGASAKAQARIVELEPLLRSTEQQLQKSTAELAAVAAPLPLQSVTERPSMEFADDEPMSLEELAGKHQLPPPEEQLSWANRTGYRLLAGIGGGTVFGISLGLLTGKLELMSLGEEWPLLVLWSILGMAVMTLVGASLMPLGKSLGDQFYRQGRRLTWLTGAQLTLTAVLLAGLVLALVMIESKVEQLGLFKALGEQTSLEASHIASGDLFWVSLMLVIPTVACYVILGFREGERLANLAHLKALRHDLRGENRLQSAYAAACKLHCQVQSLISQKVSFEAEIQALKGQVRTEFTFEEKQRLEDMEMDAAMASWEAEDALALPAPPLNPGKDPMVRRGNCFLACTEGAMRLWQGFWRKR